jgi:hypothetical protein
MKRNLLLTAAFTLFVFALSASAQKTTDFSGTWNLDASKSNAADRLQAQTLSVTQTADTIKIDRTNTKMKENPDANASGGGAGGGRPGGGAPQGPVTYGLKDVVKVSRDTPNGAVELSYGAKIDGNKLTLTSTSPRGARTETWTLNADGTLTTDSQMGQGGSVTRTYKKG